MGIYPSSFLRPMQPALQNLIEHVQAAERTHATYAAAQGK
jgi:hypothetical protein